jgi:5'-methylthioadenosine phosphorylase
MSSKPGNIAIIGGTGFEQLPPEIFAEPIELDTRFGKARVLSVSNNYVEPYKLYFLSRHGVEHGLAPHQINYAANIAALEALEVSFAFATNAVGSLRLDLPPGSLVLLDDFIDFTRHRPLSYYENTEQWCHTDFSTPYSPFLRDAVIAAAAQVETPLVGRGTYLCCDGPRFETPAEIRLFAQWGADVIGMTGLPEAVFAKEAGIEYAALAIVTNYGAGLTEQPVAHEEVVAAMANSIHLVRELLLVAGGLVIEHLTEVP